MFTYDFIPVAMVQHYFETNSIQQENNTDINYEKRLKNQQFFQENVIFSRKCNSWTINTANTICNIIVLLPAIISGVAETIISMISKAYSQFYQFSDLV